MAGIKLEELSEMEFDVLREISNIGTGNAATAVSKMLEGKIDIKVPAIKFLSFTDTADIIGGAENEVIGILVTLNDDVDGMMMFVMDKKSAWIVANHMMSFITGARDPEDDTYTAEELSQSEKEAYEEEARRKIKGKQAFTEMEISALSEFGNIISASYLSAVSTLTGLCISPSVPALADDMAGAILSVPAIEFGKVSDKVLLIQSLFEYKQKKAEGFFILVPTPEAFELIFKKLGLH